MDHTDVIKVKMRELEKKRTEDLSHARQLIGKKNRLKTPYYHKLSGLVDRIMSVQKGAGLNTDHSFTREHGKITHFV